MDKLHSHARRQSTAPSAEVRRPGAACRLGLLALLPLLILPAAPAEASEVVKLARLVITGKRLSAPPTEKPPLQRLPPVLVEGQSAATQAQGMQLALQPRATLRAL